MQTAAFRMNELELCESNRAVNQSAVCARAMGVKIQKNQKSKPEAVMAERSSAHWDLRGTLHSILCTAVIQIQFFHRMKLQVQ